MFMPALGLIRSLGGQDAERLAATQESPVRELMQKLSRKLAILYRYRVALRELNRLDERDLDDLALGRGDLPGLAWRHALAA